MKYERMMNGKNLLTVFGIRHHGPGSARSLRNALEALQPDCILIEGPPDANDLIDYVANDALKPPVAILVYNPSDLKQGAYYPFAHFSPEWQTMEYGITNDIPTTFMDLPRCLAFSLDEANAKNRQQLIRFEQENITNEGQKMAKDPLGYIAKLAGYDDSERWWDKTFERADSSSEVFTAINTMMTELRQSAGQAPLRDLQREAYMRKCIRTAIKEGFQNIAVVCGAWHGPVLEKYESYKPANDKKLLRGIKKKKTKATWVPWTYKRIARQSGYGAGVVSPAWYELLFDQSEEVSVRWMSKAAQLLRAEDLPASSAHVIEAVRLADTLAALRNLSVASINELREAATAILCEGTSTTLQLIAEKLIIGEKIGEVPDEIPVVPLQQDLNKTIKSARLTKEKAAFGKVEKQLDLRKPANLQASQLLHRLNILGIPWGTTVKNSQHTKGSFKEIWLLEWDPDFAIRIIEAGMWGNTVYEAATNYIFDQKNKQQTLAGLTQLIEAALNADLGEVITALTEALTNQSALTKDVLKLMEALPSLANVIRYGSSRRIDVGAVATVLNQTIPRIGIGLPNACLNIDEAMAEDIFQKIVSVNWAIHTLNEPKYLEIWYNALTKVMGMTANGILVGLSTRILFDKQVIDVEVSSTYLSLALSKGGEPLFGAQWIEGFLNGSGLLLIYNDSLWQIIDDWLNDLEEERFGEVLPILRRTFSQFSHPERQKMMELAKRGQQKLSVVATEEKDSLNQERVAKVLPTLKLLLDL
ncbi:MAG: DUF5682 family protein [Bacteroidota bacterium]